jgi:hypothetical protein
MSAMPGVQAVTIATPAAATAAKPAKPAHEGLSFGDLLDVINPLQHIPVVSTLYRKLTGDEMSPTAEIFGGALYGGVVGAVASIADVLFTQATGKNVGDTVYAWLGFEGKDSGTQFAQAKPAVAAPAAAPSSQTPPVQTQPAQARISAAQIAPARSMPAQPLAAPIIPAQAALVPPVGRMPSPVVRETIRPTAFVAPVRPQPPATAPTSKFMENLIKQNIDPATAARAEFAYRSALGLPIEPPPALAPGF